MRAINTEYYGDDARWFVGVVKAINDPDSLGRVRVRIFGLHTNRTDLIADTDLPWANVVMPVTHGGTSGLTPATGIQIGAQVFGMFMDGGHSQVPLVLGSIPHYGPLRVKYDGPMDPNVQGISSNFSLQYKEGDKITSNMRRVLESSGVTSTGDVLDTDQTTALNGVTAGSGDINITLIGESRAEKIYNYLREYFQNKGHRNPGYVAAAFVGNFMHEAGPRLEPNTNEDQPAVSGSRGGYGLAQWTGKARRVPLEQYAAKHKAYVGNLALQLSYITWEMENTDPGMRFVYNWLQSDQTIEAATETVFAWYENPQVSVDFKKEYAETKKWLRYMRAGGIRSFLKKTSRQSSAITAYNLEYEGRVSDAKAVYNEFGG